MKKIIAIFIILCMMLLLASCSLVLVGIAGVNFEDGIDGVIDKIRGEEDEDSDGTENGENTEEDNKSESNEEDREDGKGSQEETEKTESEADKDNTTDGEENSSGTE